MRASAAPRHIESQAVRVGARQVAPLADLRAPSPHPSPASGRGELVPVGAATLNIRSLFRNFGS
ncbi:hypothetical protein [Lysobacter gummosus]|uniref:hypothetical protein n=1 Tax=Lysobacter gummosus TaxID=262324 RepID=UPI00362D8F0F